MKLTVKYDKTKDIWCIMNYGKGSSFSSTPTKFYLEMINALGSEFDEEKVSNYIDLYLSKNNIDVENLASKFQKDWDVINQEFTKRAEHIFHTKIPQEMTAYITLNNRCPYNIKDNSFFVSAQSLSVNKIAMHELWHFYTWYAFGENEQERLGNKKYYDLKEALTVLLNIECEDLFLNNNRDSGYVEHKELREKITEYWNQEKDIKKLWEKLSLG